MATSAIEQPTFDPATLREAFSAFPSGVVAVAGMGQAGPVGLAASSFTTVSLAPPLVSVSMARSSSTWPALRVLPRIGLSVLSAEQGGLCRSLASKVTADRFADASWETSPDGAIFIHDATLWLDCTIEAELEAGDHHIILLRIESLTRLHRGEPLIFHHSRFRQLVTDADRALHISA